jgi:hypothetical protein
MSQENVEIVRKLVDGFNAFMRAISPAKPLQRFTIRRSRCAGMSERTPTPPSAFEVSPS